MRKGTNPPFTFRLPIDTKDLASAKVTFSQNGQIVLEKRLCDCTCVQNLLTVELSQEETFLFECDSVAEVQLRWIPVGGKPEISDVFTAYVSRCLDKEVLV